MAYKPPAFSIGDEVAVTRVEPVTKLRKTDFEGFITGVDISRNSDGAFVGWKYRVEAVNSKRNEFVDELDLTGKTIMLRNYTKRM